MSENGRVYSWGIGTNGRLGHGDEMNRNVPTLISAASFDSIQITAIAANGMHSLALDSNGYLWAWGANYDGRLGLGTRTTCQLTPKAIPYVRNSSGNLVKVKDAGPFVAIAAGYSHSLFLNGSLIILNNVPQNNVKLTAIL